MKYRYITTAIDYVNGSPHIGHAYEKVLADAMVRYWKLRGEKVSFLTGVDQHGQKIEHSAKLNQLSPALFVQEKSEKFRNLWKILQVDYTYWSETTNPSHKKCVQEILNHFYQKGLLYKKKYKGFYSLRQEQFLSSKDQLEDGSFSEEWGEVIELEEENWYFCLSQYGDWLHKFISKNENWVIPSFRRKDILHHLDNLEDLCISRPKTRLSWGIEIPFDTDYVTYVWFDALINYISFAGYQISQKSFHFENWQNVLHIIGKDILVPSHSIYWVIMLHALGFPDEKMPQLLVHGWWNISGVKMSKSLGNTIQPTELIENYGVDALRYYLLRDIYTGKDSNFSEERLVAIYNDELANNLGNLMNRLFNMSQRFCDGTLNSKPKAEFNLQEEREKLLKKYHQYMEEYSLNQAIDGINSHITFCNQYIEKWAPWKLAKEEKNNEFISSLLFEIAESCALISLLLSPILPKSAEKIQKIFGIKDSDFSASILPQKLKTSEEEILFPRIEIS